MSRTAKTVAMAIMLSAIALGATALLAPGPRAGEYPCDPTYNMLKNCKAQHGRWDSNCCCCVKH